MGINNTKFVAYYFALVLLIAGLAYSPWVLSSYGMFPPDYVFPLMIVGGASPTLAALIIARMEFGKKRRGLPIPSILLKGLSKALAHPICPAATGSFSLSGPSMDRIWGCLLPRFYEIGGVFPHTLV